MTHSPLWLSLASIKRVTTARLLLMLCLGLALPFWLATQGHGVLALLLAVVGLWQYPARCRADGDGLCVSWLLLEERVPWRDLEGCELVSAASWRGPAVEIARRAAPKIVLRGRERRLQLLIEGLRRHLKTRTGS